MLTVGSLFAGIGGFDLGLERAGMKVIWQSEIDLYASAVLKKHWPAVPNLGDIRGITAATVAHSQRERLEKSQLLNPNLFKRSGNAEGGKESSRTDVLCGGFPCQDISNAGKRAGIDGERSGLWAEYARVIGELRPRYVIVENVAALLGRGIERVLGDLAALGFDAEWHCIPASAVGAPHRRDRVWIVAYARSEQHEGAGDAFGWAPAEGLPANVAYARCDGGERWGRPGQLDGATSSRESGEEERQRVRDASGGRGAHVADTDESGPQGWVSESVRECAGERAIGARGASRLGAEWEPEPDVGRVANGVPSRVDRLRCLGNAIVPQIAEIIGRAIVSQHDPSPSR